MKKEAGLRLGKGLRVQLTNNLHKANCKRYRKSKADPHSPCISEVSQGQGLVCALKHLLLSIKDWYQLNEEILINKH